MNTSAQTQQTKTCTKCGAVKPSSEFGKRKTAKDGLNYCCRSCWSARYREQLKDPALYESHKVSVGSYIRRRRKEDLNFYLVHKLRCMVRRVLRAADGKKTASSQNLLGYSAKELRAHLESQFEPGMTWDDRSAWHIDHVKPVSAFIAEGIKDPQIINALSNLKPLWAKDNLAKGARY